MLERLAWISLALIHVSPGLAALSPALLTRLYGVTPGNDGFLLLRHRAALFCVIVLVCAWAAVDPATRRIATLAVAISMGSFLLLYATGGAPETLRTIAIVDGAGLAPLAYVAWRAFS